MKLLLACFTFLAIHFVSFGQFVISDGSPKYYEQPALRESHTIFFNRITGEDGEKTIENERPFIRCEYTNGLLMKQIDYSWDTGTFKGYVGSVSKYWYRDTNLIKLEISRAGYGMPEVYYYSYDKVGRLIKTIGYSGKKLIWKEDISRRSDTMFNAFKGDFYGDKRNQLSWEYFSKDSLEKFSVEKDVDMNRSYYHYKRFNNRHQIVMEVDSSTDSYFKQDYRYDSLGRLKESWRDDSDSSPKTVTTYDYQPFKTIITSCTRYNENPATKFCDELITLFYDSTGHLIYEKNISYDKLEGIVRLPGVPVERNTDESLPEGLVFLKNFTGMAGCKKAL